MVHRAGEVPLEDAALFIRARGREGVPGVETMVAEEKFARAVKLVRARLGDDLDSAPARTRELGGIRVLVDAYFLDSGGGNPASV